MSIVQKQSSPIRTRSRIVLSDSKGPLRCVSCGYEIVSYRSLPSCPMCQETNWERARWRPFTRGMSDDAFTRS